MTADEFAAKPAHMSERKVLGRHTGYADWHLKDAELLARIDHMPVLEGLQEWRKVHPEDFADLFDEDNQPRAGAPILFP